MSKKNIMQKSNRLPKRARLRGAQYTRMLNLLDMVYRLSDLANILNLSDDIFTDVYIPRGLPTIPKANQHVWIHGHVFRDWYISAQKLGKQKVPLAEDEAYCPTCNAPTKMVAPEKRIKNDTVYWLCICGLCGKQASKMIGPWRGG